MDPLSLVLSQSEAKIGDHVTVRFEGWATAAVTLTICGNMGLRGSPDCDIVGGEGIGLERSGPTLAQITVTAPPTTCPCVVRASSATTGETASAPLAIAGVPNGPVVTPTTPELVALSAKVTEVRKGLVDTLRTLLGGRTHQRVDITIRNASNVTLTKVVLGLAVGRTADGAQPVPVQPIAPMKAGESRVYVVATTLAAPTQGRYLWDVTADGAGPRVRVPVYASARPWLLYLLLVVLAVDLCAYAILRHRRRRQRRAAPTRARDTSLLTTVR